MLNFKQIKIVFLKKIIPLTVLIAVFETLAIYSIYPLISLLSGNGTPQNISNLFSIPLVYFNQNDNPLIFFSLLALVLVSLSMIIRLMGYFIIFKITQKQRVHLTKLYLQELMDVRMMSQSRDELNNSSYLSEIDHLISNYFVPLAHLINGTVVSLFLIFLMSVISLKVTLIMFTVFCILFLVIFLTIRQVLAVVADDRQLMNGYRFRLSQSIFRNLREILASRNRRHFVELIILASKKLSTAVANAQTIAFLPKILIEGLGLIGFTIFALVISWNEISEPNNQFIAKVGLSVLIGLKLLPSLQSVYNGFSQLSFSAPILRNLNSFSGKSDFVIEKPLSETVNKISVDNIVMRRNLGKSNKISSFEFLKGKLYVITGSSGSGKTTFFDQISGLIKDLPGKTIIEDNQGKEIGPETIRFGYLIQNPAFYPNLLAESFGLKAGANITKKVTTLINQLKLDHVLPNKKSKIADLNKKINLETLSVGEIQRLSILRVLIQDYDVYLFDEPTSALDEENELIVLEILKELSMTKLVLMIAHRKSCIQFADERVDFD